MQVHKLCHPLWNLTSKGFLREKCSTAYTFGSGFSPDCSLLMNPMVKNWWREATFYTTAQNIPPTKYISLCKFKVITLMLIYF